MAEYIRSAGVQKTRTPAESKALFDAERRFAQLVQAFLLERGVENVSQLEAFRAVAASAEGRGILATLPTPPPPKDLSSYPDVRRTIAQLRGMAGVDQASEVGKRASSYSIGAVADWLCPGGGSQAEVRKALRPPLVAAIDAAGEGYITKLCAADASLSRGQAGALFWRSSRGEALYKVRQAQPLQPTERLSEVPGGDAILALSREFGPWLDDIVKRAEGPGAVTAAGMRLQELALKARRADPFLSEGDARGQVRAAHPALVALEEQGV